jgi:polar amino acid transport system substrate-binding protein
VVKDTASAKVLKSVVPGATLKSYDTPIEALNAFYEGDVPILGGGTLWLAANNDPAATGFSYRISVQGCH